MRRVIGIDSTHLKGKYGGCMLTASCQDANFQIFPLAFGVVDRENDTAWEWFFRGLSSAIPDSETLTFVSDRHSSIYTGLRRVYPKSHHGACTVHQQRNITSSFKKKLLAFHVSRAARAYRICDFHTYFNEVIKLDPACGAYLETIGFSHWTRAYFLGNRYNVMISNVAESLNSVLKEARELPVIPLGEFIRTTLISWFEYQVQSNSGGNYHVNLGKWSCTCRAFDMLYYPCPHAISAAVTEDITLQSIMAPEYSVDNWRQSYKASIKPVPDVSNAYPLPASIASLDLQPPFTRRPPGRPKKKRIASRGELW
ncbi:PREDICTED: uncharacterized protein LOC104783702 [Camelina sativa]|uniref:Uncharacterized protein LOC104783702 n=1 Tax=Camelina sativa TaxID=90675 RepID=A0ABM0YWX9_CAMSA|nr:PREDICTED: uncharacterized protein LOC104783702 [Camelina sativa]